MAGNELAHPAGHDEVEHHKAEHDEPVVAPDQLKPQPFRRLTVLAALTTAALLVLMAFFGNHEGDVEKYYLVGIAALIVIALVGDFFLRKAGLRKLTLAVDRTVCGAGQQSRPHDPCACTHRPARTQTIAPAVATGAID